MIQCENDIIFFTQSLLNSHSQHFTDMHDFSIMNINDFVSLALQNPNLCETSLMIYLNTKVNIPKNGEIIMTLLQLKFFTFVTNTPLHHLQFVHQYCVKNILQFNSFLSYHTNRLSIAIDLADDLEYDDDDDDVASPIDP